jgi:hypothetical protein
MIGCVYLDETDELGSNRRLQTACSNWDRLEAGLVLSYSIPESKTGNRARTIPENGTGSRARTIPHGIPAGISGSRARTRQQVVPWSRAGSRARTRMVSHYLGTRRGAGLGPNSLVPVFVGSLARTRCTFMGSIARTRMYLWWEGL